MIHAQKDGTLVNAQVFTKTESHQGFESNATAWTLIQSLAIESKGPGQLTPLPFLPEPLAISAGSVQAFYVTVDSGDICYTDGSNVRVMYVSDGGIQIFEGAGIVYPFGKMFSPRVWNGLITYVHSKDVSASSSWPKSSPLVLPSPSSDPSIEPSNLLTGAPTSLQPTLQ